MRIVILLAYMSKPNAQEDVNKGDLTKKILFSAYGLVKKEDTLRAECEDWNKVLSYP